MTDDTAGTKTAWIVVKKWIGGKIQPVAGYMDEERARLEAGQLIGRDGADCHISLWTVEIHDD